VAAQPVLPTGEQEQAPPQLRVVLPPQLAADSSLCLVQPKPAQALPRLRLSPAHLRNLPLRLRTQVSLLVCEESPPSAQQLQVAQTRSLFLSSPFLSGRPQPQARM
jgi:hypothetical protein